MTSEELDVSTVSGVAPADPAQRMAPRVLATTPCLAPPAWAVAERALFDLLDRGWRRFEALFTRADGSLRYGGELHGRDGGDDFLESFFNWPQLYLLGGADDLLSASARHWHGVVGQLTQLGVFRDEFEIGYDWFHQGEALLFFYSLTMADPLGWRERAMRFADLYVDPAFGNFDPELGIVRGPHNGSGGARDGVADGSHYPWLPAEAEQYGYPLSWLLPDDSTTPPLDEDPRLGHEMQARMGRGDVVGNLAISGLVLNAYLVTGEQRYADWISSYVGGWQRRAEANGGIVPDNVGVDGVVGSQLDGRWYGGHYGWSWPHGLYSIGQAVMVGALAASIATGEDSYLQMPRALLDAIIAQGRRMRFADSDSSIRARWLAHLGPNAQREGLLVPFRHDDRGWFDWNPIQAALPLALWHRTQQQDDRLRIERLRAASADRWSEVRPFRDKEEAGHEEPWYSYLNGDLPDYPERILAAAQTQARRRLALMEQYAGIEVPESTIHLWQDVNPVVTEALCQLTWGAPQVIYDGGVPQARLRYYDAITRRPGLPRDVAALVSSIDPAATTVTLVNLAAVEQRSVIVQAGSFAEDDIVEASYDSGSGGWAGKPTEYLPQPVARSTERVEVGGPWLEVTLPAGSEITLTLTLRCGARRAALRTPWLDPTALGDR